MQLLAATRAGLRGTARSHAELQVRQMTACDCSRSTALLPKTSQGAALPAAQPAPSCSLARPFAAP